MCSLIFQTPQSFMTDNSEAEKAALQAVWPEATQLLCHFHVAQAEWRWLHASSNKISRDERRDLMTAFQKVCVNDAPSSMKGCVLEPKIPALCYWRNAPEYAG